MAFMVSFNAYEVTPQSSPEPLPTGTYDVAIVGTEEKPVKDGNGKTYYEILMQVISGEFAGRKIIDRLNMRNDNEDARRIAASTFSAICYVTGVMVIQRSSAELHNRPFKVRVSKVPRDDRPDQFQNRVNGYLDTMGYEPGKNPGITQIGGYQPMQDHGQPSGFGQQPQPQQAAPQFAQQPQAPQTQAAPSFAQPTQTAPQFAQAPQPQQQPQPVPQFAQPTQAAPQAPQFAQQPQAPQQPPVPSFAQAPQQPQQPPVPQFAQAPQQQAAPAPSFAQQPPGGVPSWATA